MSVNEEPKPMDLFDDNSDEKLKASLKEKFKKLQIKDDFMFSTVMKNPELCKTFLERVLNLQISNIQYSEIQKTINVSVYAKGVRLDVYVVDDKNTVYNAEMQTTTNSNLSRRARYYQGMIDMDRIQKGANYKELDCSFVVFVCTFDPFDEGRYIYTFENRCIQNTELGLGDATTKVFLNTKGTKGDITQELKILLDYMDGKEPADKFTRDLESEVESIRKNKSWEVQYMTLEIKYQEKIAEGRAEGEARERVRVFRKMFLNGKTSKDIADFMGIPIEEVEKIKKTINIQE